MRPAQAFKHLFKIAVPLLIGSAAHHALADTYSFSQMNYNDGATVTGYFTGNDSNNNGYIETVAGYSELTNFSLSYSGSTLGGDFTLGLADLLSLTNFGGGMIYVVGSSTLGGDPGGLDGALYVGNADVTLIVTTGYAAGYGGIAFLNTLGTVTASPEIMQITHQGNQVPEPSSILLAMLGGGALMRQRRSRKAKTR
ncbi:PEP-CTERM sorting domain-containing protein [Zoogloea sp.]|uniref:PEP-CTERM sorting domain-containing protein n=1 Tax=Zoogloea sp. TaxID=49181 RepID=UPI0035AE6110